MSWQHDSVEIAEMTVLGHMLNARHPLTALADVVLSADDFYFSPHPEMFASMQRQLITSDRVDPIRLMKSLGGVLDLAGGKEYFKTLRKYSMGNIKAKQAAEAVLDTARRRRLEEHCHRAITMSQDYTQDVSEAHAVLHRALQDTAGVKAKRSESIGTIADEYLEQLEARRSGKLQGLTTGFYDLDDITGGMGKGELICLAACPGNGKSALALNLAVNVVERGMKVGIFSMEMVGTEIMERIISRKTGIPATNLKKGLLTHEQLETVKATTKHVSSYNMRLCDTATVTPIVAAERARLWNADIGGLDLVVVDYLQLMKPLQRGHSRENEVSAASRAMKELAMALDCPVLMLSQVNRESAKGGSLKLWSLRESGALEQDSNQVWLIQPWEPNNTNGNPQIEIEVAKNRGGRTGKCSMVFFRNTMTFTLAVKG